MTADLTEEVDSRPRSRTTLWVEAQPGPVTSTDVAEALGISLQAAAVALRKAERRGHLEEYGFAQEGRGRPLRWRPATAARRAPRPTQQDQILAFLAEQFEPVTAFEVGVGVQVKTKIVVECLRRLRAEGRALQVGTRKRSQGRGRSEVALWVAA